MVENWVEILPLLFIANWALYPAKITMQPDQACWLPFDSKLSERIKFRAGFVITPTPAEILNRSVAES